LLNKVLLYARINQVNKMKSLKRIDTEKYYGTNMIPVSEPNITEKELDYVTDAV